MAEFDAMQRKNLNSNEFRIWISLKKRETGSPSLGNPAVFVFERPAAFRPYLTASLAFLRYAFLFTNMDCCQGVFYGVGFGYLILPTQQAVTSVSKKLDLIVVKEGDGMTKESSRKNLKRYTCGKRSGNFTWTKTRASCSVVVCRGRRAKMVDLEYLLDTTCSIGSAVSLTLLIFMMKVGDSAKCRHL